jgi:hypothetical protein
MEKGLKLLQSTARTAQRKASADHQANEDQGISDHNSDSGIVLCSGSEPDLEATDERSDSVPASGPVSSRHGASASWSESYSRQQHRLHQEHLRSRSLPLPLPQYQPPLPVSRAGKVHGGAGGGRAVPSASNLGAISFGNPAYAMQRYSPETQQRLSIQAVLSPEEPSDVASGHREAMNYERDGHSRRYR